MIIIIVIIILIIIIIIINFRSRPVFYWQQYMPIEAHVKRLTMYYWGLRLLLFKNSSVGSITSHKN